MHKLVFNDIHDRHLGRAIRMQAEQNGDTRFILADDQVYTYTQTNARVNALAEGLRRLGVERGDRVIFYMTSAPEVMFLVLAVAKLGAVWVPVSSEYKGALLADTINRGRARILVTDDDHADRIAAVHDDLNVEHFVTRGDVARVPRALPLEGLFVSGAAEPDLTGLDYGDTAAILWTSGTTGKSKGVMQSHNVWLEVGRRGDENYDTRPGDVAYNVMPMYNSAAWSTSIFRSLYAGITLAMDPVFSVSKFWDRVRYYNVTQGFTLSAMHMYLWNAPERPDDADNPMRELTAAPMPDELKAPFEKRFGLKILGQAYSQSEAMGVIRQDLRLRSSWPRGSCGNSMGLHDLRLVDDEGRDVPTGSPGELWLREKKPFTIFNGYFDDPEVTAAAFSGEWYKTGDVLKRDEDDIYFFVDRKKDVIRHKGLNISSFAIEAIARQNAAVAEVAAFGIPSAEVQHEDDIKLNVVLKPGLSATPVELAELIAANAPKNWVPRYIEIVDALPYTPNQKVQKYKLREAGVTSATWDARKEGFVPA